MTMLLIQVLILLLVATTAPAVVLTRNPVNQTIGISFYGLLLGIMFFVFQAPDVALSQITVGAVALPLIVLLGLAEVRRREREQRASEQQHGRNHEPERGGKAA